MKFNLLLNSFSKYTVVLKIKWAIMCVFFPEKKVIYSTTEPQILYSECI